VLRSLGAPTREVHAQGDAASLTIPLLRVPDFARVSAALTALGMRVRSPDRDPVGEVSLVGAGVTHDGAVLLDALALAGDHGGALAVSTSPLRLTLRVAASAVDPLTRALHERFLGAC
jgi:hypothetical protein